MSEDEQLRTESLQIEHLLDEIKELVTPPAWQRVERVIGRVVRLYGAGLSRALDHARTAGVSTPVLEELVANDDLLASLLLLHGLHPLSIEERISRVLVTVREELGLAADDLVLVAARDDHVHLHAAVELGGGAMASRVAEASIRRVIENVAPEVKAVEISGTSTPPDPTLVQLRTRREAR